MNYLRIVARGWEKFSGTLGMVHFKDGVSTFPVPQTLADRVAALTNVELLDDKGESLGPAGPAHRIIGTAAVSAPIGTDKIAVTPEEHEAEQRRIVEKAGKNPAGRIYSVAELQRIADQKGIKGLREIGDAWGVRERSIPGLIKEIMHAQAEFERNRRLEETKRVAASGLTVDPTTVDMQRFVGENIRVFGEDVEKNVGRSIELPDMADQVAAAITSKLETEQKIAETGFADFDDANLKTAASEPASDQTPNAIDENGENIFIKTEPVEG